MSLRDAFRRLSAAELVAIRVDRARALIEMVCPEDTEEPEHFPYSPEMMAAVFREAISKLHDAARLADREKGKERPWAK